MIKFSPNSSIIFNLEIFAKVAPGFIILNKCRLCVYLKCLYVNIINSTGKITPPRLSKRQNNVKCSDVPENSQFDLKSNGI